MAITISGENNNDRILAQDGVIDQISGINFSGIITASHINVGDNIQLGNAGIITATTFVGNVTGNVNSTSPLLLQTGGSERIRLTSNNEIGIAGANYGSAGQVLTSGGSGSAVSWSTISTDLVNDSSPQLGGDLDVNGKKIKFPDLTGSVNNILYFGTGNDLLIYHHADVNYIQCENARTLRFQYWTGSGNETLANFIPNGAVQLYHNDTKTFETTNEGATFDTGSSSCVVRLTSNTDAVTVLQGYNSDFYLKGPSGGNLILYANANEDAIKCIPNGAVELYHNGNRQVFTIDGGMNWQDSKKAEFGNSGDLKIYHESGVNYIYGTGTNAPTVFMTGAEERLRIDSTGKSVFKQNNGSTNNTYQIVAELNARTTGSTAANFGPALYLSHTFAGVNYAGSLITSQCDADVNTTHISFFPRNYGWTEALRITKDGIIETGTAAGASGADGNQRLRVGRVGDCNIAVRATGSTTAFTGLDFGDQDDDRAGRIQYAHDGNYMTFHTNGGGSGSANERIRIDSSGKIGISRTPTQHPLEIGHASEPTISLWRGSTKSAALQAQSGGTYLYSYENAPLLFSVNSGSGFKERLRIESGGEIRLTSENGNNSDTPGFTFRGGSSSQKANFARIHSRMVSNWGGQLQFKVKDDNGSLSDAYRTAMIINHNGHVTKPETPAFFATHTGAGNSIIGTLPYNTSGNGYYNNGGHLDVSSGRFHAPVNGIYTFHFHGFFQVNQSSGYFEVVIRRTNSNGGGAVSLTRQYGYRNQPTNEYGPSISMHCTTYLTAGQRVEVSTGGQSFHGSNGYFFGGHLLG